MPKPKAQKKTPKPPPEVRRVGRRKTGRTVPFSVKLTPDTANQIYDISREDGCLVAEVVERALVVLAEKRKRG